MKGPLVVRGPGSTKVKYGLGAQIGGSGRVPLTARLGGAHLPGAAWAPCLGGVTSGNPGNLGKC